MRLLAAAMQDAGVFRAFLETVLCLALPEEVLARPAVAAAVDRLGDKQPRPFPGPDRHPAAGAGVVSRSDPIR